MSSTAPGLKPKFTYIIEFTTPSGEYSCVEVQATRQPRAIYEFLRDNPDLPIGKIKCRKKREVHQLTLNFNT